MNDPRSSPAARDGGARASRGDRRGIVRTVQRRARLFGAVLAGTLALAALVTALWKPAYLAAAEVVFDPRGGGDDATATEISIIRSREMARAVAAELGRGGAPATVEALRDGLTVAPVPGAYTLTIGFTAGDPQTAARAANAFAAQYAAGRLAGAAGEPSPLERPNARIISRAVPPLAPVSPSWPLNLALGAILGGLLGLVAAVVAEARLSGLTSGRELEARLGLHHLGSVPILGSVLDTAATPLDAVVEAPLSAFAEAFRSVLMSIRHAGGRGTQVIALTSALANEGKTTIAACLARTVALAGEAVVLVDCDARRRDASALFVAAPHRPGLAELLRYEATLDEVLVRDAASGAWVLPLTGPPADLTELLCGPAMDALLHDLRRRFRRVLIDTAPVLPISGTRAIAAMADVLVLVVHWRHTADHAVATALRLLEGEHVRIAGAVLSQVDMRRQVRLGHGDPAFYYKQYSKYYT